MSMETAIAVTGVVLAGGRSTRMGGQDKGLVEFRGKTLIEHVIEAFAPQVDELLINANRNTDRYELYGYTVITDTLPDYPGPLAGMMSGLTYAAHEYVVFVPCDVPLLPTDLVMQLLQGVQASGKRVAVAHDGKRLQPLHALVHRDCRESLETYLASGARKVEDWMQQQSAVQIDFSGRADGFFNLNTPAELHGNR